MPLLFPDVGNRLAERLHDLKITVVDPDAALKVTFFSNDLFRSNVENVAMQLVFLLLPDIKNLIFRNFVAGEHEGQPMPDIVQVLGRH